MTIEYDKLKKDINTYSLNLIDYVYWFVWKIIIPIAFAQSSVLFTFRYIFRNPRVPLSICICSAVIVLMAIIMIFVWFCKLKSVFKNKFFKNSDTNHSMMTKIDETITLTNEAFGTTYVFTLSEIEKYKIYKKTIIVTVGKIGNIIFPNLPEIKYMLMLDSKKKEKTKD